MNGVDPDLEHASRSSKGCPICDGGGQVVVFHSSQTAGRVERVWLGELDEDDREIRVAKAMEVTAHCTCPMGRWIRERTSVEARRTIPDVKDIVEGRSRWMLSPPGFDETAQADPRVMERFFRWATQKTNVA